MKNNKIFAHKTLFFLFLLLLCLQTFSSLAQSTPLQYGGKFKISVGDVFQYQYTTYYNGDIEHIYDQRYFYLANGKYIHYNVTPGLKFTIKVTTINTTGVYSIITFDIPNVGNFSEAELPEPGYIGYSFPNVSSITSYCKQYMNHYTNSSYGNYTYAIQGNLYYFYFNGTNDGQERFSFTARNWKTGILTSEFNVRTDVNGSVYYKSQYDLVYSKIQDTTTTSFSSSNTTPGFTFVPFILIALTLSYKKIKHKIM